MACVIRYSPALSGLICEITEFQGCVEAPDLAQ